MSVAKNLPLIAAFAAIASPLAAQHTLGPWHTLIATASDSPSALESRIEIAFAANELGDPGRAIAVLGDVPADTSALFVDWLIARAEAATLMQSHEEAALLYEQAASLVVGIRAGVLVARAALARGLSGDSARSAESFARAAEMLPAIRSWLAIRAALMSGDLADARDALMTAPAAASVLANRALGKARIVAGDTIEAIGAFLRADSPVEAAAYAIAMGDRALADSAIVIALGNSRDREAALDLLNDNQSLLENDAVAATAAYAYSRIGKRTLALDILEGLADRRPTDAQVHLDLARLRETLGERAAALETYRLAVRLDAGTRAEYELARLHFRMRDWDAALQMLSDFSEEYPDDPSASASLYLVADRLSDIGDSRSDSIYARLARSYGRDEFASRARMILADRALRSADTAAAVEWLNEEFENRGPEMTAAAFRAALLAERLGAADSARTALTRLAASDPIGFYGLQARSLLGTPGPRLETSRPEPASEAVVEGLEVLDLLRDAGLREEFEFQLDYLVNQAELTPVEMLDLSAGLSHRDRVREAIRLGWRASGRAGLRDARVVQAIFPWPRRSLIEGEAAKHGLDPYIVAALIRQESAFEPGAVSRAGATGMMQLMPATARQVAQRQRVSWSEDHLTVADANVHLGTTHLAALLRQYDGDLVLALTAYNAGGGNLRRWLRRYGYSEARSLEFIERIPFPETRGYVKAVLRNRELYRSLYPPAAGAR